MRHFGEPWGYAPILAVSKKKTNNKVGITITDNGIPRNIVNKIFQPLNLQAGHGLGANAGVWILLKCMAGK
jgi:C4-dicarboxylate-specific signal transduction histidine kinase